MTDPTPSLPTPASICRATGCTKPTRLKGGRCEAHTVERGRERNAPHNAQRAYYHTPEWQALRKLCIDAAYGQCVACGASGPAARLTAHHIKARKEGGADALSNLACVCHRCHGRIERGDDAATERLDEWIGVRDGR